jgi:hypothetical protein
MELTHGRASIRAVGLAAACVCWRFDYRFPINQHLVFRSRMDNIDLWHGLGRRGLIGIKALADPTDPICTSLMQS